MKSEKKILGLSNDILSKDKDAKKKDRKEFLLLGVISIYRAKYFCSGKNLEYVIVMILPSFTSKTKA